ncbi:hypothetical protein DCC84_04765 [Pseudomonas sp. SXM-1]|nr:hypothetical protein DCC84_04765 [Pseudomonas sp. SXM-1]
MRQFVDHGYSRKNDLMDGQRAVFERGMLAQRLILLRGLARSKRYINIPLGLARLDQMWERACSRMRCVSQCIWRLMHRIREQARSHMCPVVFVRSGLGNR